MSTATVHTAAPSAPADAPAGRAPHLVHRTLPWLAVAGVLTVALADTDVTLVDTLRYALYVTAGIVLPGTLVHRALRGSRGNLPEDIGYGAATGLLLELAAWGVFVTTGASWVLRAWQAPVILAFLAVPRLRRLWRIAEPRPAPAAWCWTVAASLGAITVWLHGIWRSLPLPPTTVGYYQDLLYHMSLVREVMRPLPFDQPQYAGEPIHYHLLVDAHIGSASLTAGVDPNVALMRLWYAPILFAGVLAFAALARELTGRWLAGPVAAVVILFAEALWLGGPMRSTVVSPILAFSPSTLYLLPLLALLVAGCAAAVRGQPLGGGWALLPAAGLACAGAKFNAPPVIIAGLLAATVVAALTRRRVPWPALAALALVVAATVAGGYLFVDRSGRGTGLQFLSMVQWSEPYRAVVEPEFRMGVPGTLPAAMADADRGDWGFVWSLVAWYEIAQLPLLLGFLALARRRTRTDPATWLLAGAVVAATAALWSVFHPSMGQLYFTRCAMPLGLLLTVWLAVDGLHRRAGATVLAAAVVAGLAGTVLLSRSMPAGDPAPTARAWLVAMFAPLAVAVAAVALASVAWLLAASWARRRPAEPAGRLVGGLAGGGVAVLAAVVLGASITPNVRSLVHDIRDLGTPEPAAAKNQILAAEMRAAMWLDRHAGPDDVVATNVRCQPVRTRPSCDARSFWVSGLSGRRVLLEGWAYTPWALAGHGVDELSYAAQPPKDPDRLAHNDAAFTAPTAASLALLHSRYGVRWLLADKRAAPVSPALASLATERYSDGPVTVYELAGPPPAGED